MPLATRVNDLATRIGAEVKLKVNSTRQIIAGTGLTGGGTLATDRTLAVSYGTAAGTATQGNDSRVQYEAPVMPAFNTAKFTNFSTAGDYSTLQVWRQGRTAYAMGLIKNTVDLGFGGHIVLNNGAIPASLRPLGGTNRGTVVGASGIGDRSVRVDVSTAGAMVISIGLWTATAGSAIPVNMSWPLD